LQKSMQKTTQKVRSFFVFKIKEHRKHSMLFLTYAYMMYVGIAMYSLSRGIVCKIFNFFIT